MRNIQYINSHTFLVTLFFGITKCSKKERIEGIPVQKNLPLFTFDEQLKFNCKSFWSILLRLEMPQHQIATLLSVSSEAFLSIYISVLIFQDKKIQRFSCCGRSVHCQWCTTLSCLMKVPFGANEAQLEIEDLEWKCLGIYYSFSGNGELITFLPTFVN